jgi:hypothetical protein
MREKDKPWEAIGMSRANWYRHAKHTSKPWRYVSVRSRTRRVLREAPELAPLLEQGLLELGSAEKLARGGPEMRRAFFEILVTRREGA